MKNSAAKTVASPALSVLREVFGYTSFRGDQEAIIEHVLSGGDAVVLMPTGGGKSLCYQVPALVLEGTAIVVSPLIALMRDQVAALQQAGVSAEMLNSGLDIGDWQVVRDKVQSGIVDLLYVSPERIVSKEFQELIENVPLALLAIDEAHCVSQWGHDFRPEYRQLGELPERFRSVPRIALTATADEPTRNEIITNLSLERAEVFIAGFDRPNIKYTITLKTAAFSQLKQFLASQSPEASGIVYCLSRKKTESVAQQLQDAGFNALPYHAGLSADKRSHHQDRFLREDGIIIVATVAFGMGIDKPDVRFVAHLDLPKSIESYYQETGRAGRDGLPAEAWMVYGLGDLVMLRQMIERSDSSVEHKFLEQRKLNSLLGLAETMQCRRQVLLAYFGDTLLEPCNNCDTCLTHVEGYDGTELAQKVLSCVYRTRQRFGAHYIVNVLRGQADDRMEKFGHTGLPVFGIGKDIDKRQWLSIIRQLIAAQYLQVDMEGYGSLMLTPKSKELLRGEVQVQFRKDPVIRKNLEAQKSGSKAYADSDVLNSEDAQNLWKSLRKVRTELAKSQGVPPYVIFHDKTLLEIVGSRPVSRAAFLEVSGVGESKLEKYGDVFIEAVRAHEGR